jgi:hypothetical protein
MSDFLSPLPKAGVIATLYSCECAKRQRPAEWYFDLLGITEDVEVAGSSLFQANIAAAVTARQGQRLQVALVPEPANPHHKLAVRVDLLVNGEHLKAGYLRRGEARRYFKVLAPLASDGLIGVASARPWKGEVGWRLYLRLNEPEWVLPRTGPDDRSVVFVAERDTAVIGEEAFQDVLLPLLGRRKIMDHTFRLRAGEVPKGKNRGLPVIEVLDNDRMVGRLTTGKSDDYLPGLKVATAKELVPYAVGYLERDPKRGVQITLFLPVAKYRTEKSKWFYGRIVGPDPLD